jgi:hypothetical protein
LFHQGFRLTDINRKFNDWMYVEKCVRVTLHTDAPKKNTDTVLAFRVPLIGWLFLIIDVWHIWYHNWKLFIITGILLPHKSEYSCVLLFLFVTTWQTVINFVQQYVISNNTVYHMYWCTQGLCSCIPWTQNLVSKTNKNKIKSLTYLVFKFILCGFALHYNYF